MPYRVRQFFNGLFAEVSEEDKKFVRTYLNDDEVKLFFSMSKVDQLHSIKVARQIIFDSMSEEVYDVRLIKGGLLHDVGKIGKGLNIFTKSILVIMNRVMPKFTKKLCFLKSVDAYYNHAQIALKFLPEENEYVRYLVSNHHNYKIQDDTKLKLLQKADSDN